MPNPQGSRPGLPLAALKKAADVMAGPCGRTVSVAVAEKVLTVAVTTRLPVFTPAVTVTDTSPLASVVPCPAESDPVP